MPFRTLAASLPIAFLLSWPTLAAEPKAVGPDVTEIGSFDCTSSIAGGKATWSCPAQTFDTKFAEAPEVTFAIAGFSKVAITGGGGISLDVSTVGEITHEGFSPVLDTTLTPAAGADKSVVIISWTAVGASERVHKARKERRANKVRGANQ